MSFNSRDVDGTQASEREELLKKFLPSPTGSQKQPTGGSKSRDATTVTGFGIRQALREHVYGLVYTLIHAAFSVYVRVRIAYRAVALRTVSVLYYHHRTPEYIRRDVHALPRLPKHVSVILTLEEGGKRSDAKEKLISEVADIASWCASAGISMLSVYERSGVLKSNMELSHRKVSSKLRDWFGKFQAPDLHLHAPNLPVIHPSYYSAPGRQQEPHHGMSVMLISAEDGRESMVDLTKVLTQMAQRSKLSTADITTDVIDSELTNSVMNEPDLLISFAPFVDLQGYPPWQIRLTELYCEKDNQNGVEYQVFLNGLRKYAAATFKLGK